MSIEELRGIIGLAVFYRGTVCFVIEVLEDGPALVLLDGEHHTSLQSDQFGDPRRQVPKTWVVPIWKHSGEEFHDDFLSLELLDEDRC